NLTAELSHHDSRPAPVVTVRTGRTLDGPISECDRLYAPAALASGPSGGLFPAPGRWPAARFTPPRRSVTGWPKASGESGCPAAMADCPCSKSNGCPAKGRRSAYPQVRLAGSWVPQRDPVRPGDAAGLDGSQSLAQTLASLPQELERVGEGALRGGALRISLV